MTESTMRPLYIFDLDGTLANIEHRKGKLDEKHNWNRWREFYAACDRDTPHNPVISTMERLRTAGAEVWVFSGRSTEVRDKTVAWLLTYTSFTARELDTALTMRCAGDYRADDTVKLEWYDSMLIDDQLRLVAVFDDRSRVVDMWRANGVPCFQVAPGDF